MGSGAPPPTRTAPTHFLGPFLETLAVLPPSVRERHFSDSVSVGERLLTEISAKLDSNWFQLKAIRSENRFLSDLSLNWTLNLRSTDDDLELKDVVVVAVVEVCPKRKRLLTKRVDDDMTTPDDRLKSEADLSFDQMVDNRPDLRNPFAFRPKFSSLLFPKEKPRPPATEKPPKSPSPDSSSSSSSSSSFSSSSDSSEKRKKRQKMREKSQKISFEVKKSDSKRQKAIPGFGGARERTSGGQGISERMRAQLKRDEAIEEKIRLVSKKVKKF